MYIHTWGGKDANLSKEAQVLCVCVCVCVCVCMCDIMYLYTCMHAYIMFVVVWVCVCLYVSCNVFIYTHVCMYTGVVYVCVCVFKVAVNNSTELMSWYVCVKFRAVINLYVLSCVLSLICMC